MACTSQIAIGVANRSAPANTPPSIEPAMGIGGAVPRLAVSVSVCGCGGDQSAKPPDGGRPSTPPAMPCLVPSLPARGQTRALAKQGAAGAGGGRACASSLIWSAQAIARPRAPPPFRTKARRPQLTTGRGQSTRPEGTYIDRDRPPGVAAARHKWPSAPLASIVPSPLGYRQYAPPRQRPQNPAGSAPSPPASALPAAHRSGRAVSPVAGSFPVGWGGSSRGEQGVSDRTRSPSVWCVDDSHMGKWARPASSTGGRRPRDPRATRSIDGHDRSTIESNIGVGGS